MLAADEALVVKAGGPTLVRPGLSADIYSGKAVMMKLMGPFDMAGGGGSLQCCFEIPLQRLSSSS